MLSRRGVLAAFGLGGATLAVGQGGAAAAESGDLAGTVTDPTGAVFDVAGPVALSGSYGQVEISGTVRATRRPALAPAYLADGRDASQELGDWLRALPPGSTADLGGLTYRCETHLKLTDPQALTIRNGALTRTVKTEDPNFYYPKPNPHLWLLRPVDCAVEGLTVRGTNTVADQRAGFGSYLAKYEFDAAIRAEAFTNLTVTGLDADGIWGDGVQLQKGARAVVRDSLIDRIGRQGVTVIASDVLCDNVQVLHGRRAGFDLEPDLSTQVCSGIEIRNSFARTIGLPFASAGRGQVNDVWVHHNRSAGSSVPMLHCSASDGSRRSGWRLEDHVAENGLGSPVAAVRFGNTDGIAVRRVTLPVVATQSRLAFQLTGCGGVCEVTDSDFGAGNLYRNTTPAAGQTLTVERNTPVLVEAV